MQEENEALKRALKRERLARKFAEKTLEEKASELFSVNQELKVYADRLEEKVVQRTQEVERIARFPDENPSPIVRFTKSSKLEYYNAAAKNIIQHPVFYDFVENYVKEVFLRNTTMVRELHLGDVIYAVTIVPLINEDYVNFYFSDVTKERVSSIKLLQSEEKYRSIIENMQLGLLEVDNDNKITKAYNHFCALTGYEESELLGLKAVDVFTKDEEVKSLINKERLRRSNGEENVYEVKIVKKDGTAAWVLISGAPLFDEDGNVTGSIGIHLDITRMKIIEQELREARVKAEESSRSKELFLANMSHEIRTPMHAIIGMSDLLLKTSLTESQDKMMQAINLSSHNLLVIINDILDLTKVDSGKMSLESIGFKLKDIINHIVRTNELKSQAKDLLFEVEDNVLEPIFIGDPYRLTQILLNLTSNAVKFTDHGRVRLIVDSENINEKYCRLTFHVVDTGKGIKKELLTHVFESFAQEDESISRNFGGTGLGLSITKKLVEIQNGFIYVESELDVGSTFTFYIDYLLGEQKDLPSVNDEELNYSQLKGLDVLLAEDNEFNQTLIENLFVEFGINLTIANNGKEALEALSKSKFDVVLMDIQMPEMDGVEATKYIREDDSLNEMPILALTANAFQNELDKYLSYGMNDYLSKPFKPIELYTKILTLTGKQVINFIDCSKEKESEKEKVVSGDNLFSMDKLIEMSGNNQAFIDKMVGAFVEHTPPILNELEHACSIKDWKSVGSLCHRLKASLNTFAIDSVSEDLVLLEYSQDDYTLDERQCKVERILLISRKVIELLK